MGYHTYIATIPKKEYNVIKSMNKQQLIKHYNINIEQYQEEDYIGLNVYSFGKALYEFGKYDNFNPPKKSLKTFFKNKELNKIFTNENDFNVVTPEFLEYVILTYKQRTADYYNSIVTPFLGTKNTIVEKENPCDFLNSIKVDYNSTEKNVTFDFNKITQEQQNALFEIIEHVRTNRFEWTHLTNFELKNGDTITTSNKYEYNIFELIRIYKTFNWKKNIMFYYGF